MEQEIRDDGELQLSNETAIALIRKIGGGDPSALATLYDRTSRLLFGLVLRVLKNRVLAEEALLDVYTHIWKQSAAYDPRLLPLEWLTTIARARALARLHWSRRDRMKRELPAGNLDPGMTVAPQVQRMVRSSIGSLVPTQRDILDCAYYSGLSCSEIAAQIGRPIGAVKTHARLGLGKLCDLLHPLFKDEKESPTTTGGHIEARTSD